VERRSSTASRSTTSTPTTTASRSKGQGPLQLPTPGCASASTTSTKTSSARPSRPTSKVLDIGPKENAYYDEALYKLAWTYLPRRQVSQPAIKHFDQLVVYADKEQAKRTGKAGSSMRPESIQYLAVSFAEEDWDGDQKPDGVTRHRTAPPTPTQGREKEKHVYEVYRRLADIYFDTTKYDAGGRGLQASS
jgi:hypothetical protein